MKINDILVEVANSQYRPDLRAVRRAANSPIPLTPVQGDSEPKMPGYTTPLRGRAVANRKAEPESTESQNAFTQQIFDQVKQALPNQSNIKLLNGKDIVVVTDTNKTEICLPVKKNSTGKINNIFIEAPAADREDTTSPKAAIIDALEGAGLSVNRRDGREGSKAAAPGVGVSISGAGSITAVIKIFKTVVDTIAGLGEHFKTSTDRSSKRRRETAFRYYFVTAEVIFAEAKRGRLSDRGHLDMDKSDPLIKQLVVKGITAGGYQQYHAGRNPYREHAVPCKLILDTAQTITREGIQNRLPEREIISQIAVMIRNNLIIVLCSDAEAEQIDKTHKTIMPTDSWTETNANLLARFKEYGIRVYSFDAATGAVGQRIAESD